MAYLFIVNPVAGSGRTKKYKDLIASYMDDRKLKYKIIETKNKGEATNLVHFYKDDYEVFVAVGGDGTIKEVAEGVYMAKKTLAIIPLGTANDLAKALNLSSNINHNLDLITRSCPKTMDVGWVNSGFFLNIASLGYDSEVIVNYNKMDRLKSKVKYILAVIKTFFKFKAFKSKIFVDGKVHGGDLTLLAIGNGKYYGGYFKVLPESKLDDDFLHVCIVKDISKFKIFLLFPSIIFGKHINFKKYVKILKGREILVKSEEKFHINLDGEILEETDRAKFIIGRDKLKVIY